MLITVFTPTYNRGHLLPELFRSLCRQEFTDFEWVVVDDGSKDDTETVMREIMDGEHGFPIRYFKTVNGGKHRAVNRGVEEARGELFFIADSDDQLTDDALQVVADTYDAVRDNPKIGGVCALDCQKDGTTIGSGLPMDMIDCTSLDIRFKYHVTGDLKEIFLTRVLKEIPMPEIDGEKFSPEALTWNRIAAKYQLRFINRPIYIVEYQPDGLTSSIIKIRMNSPIASMMTYAEMLYYNIPFMQKVKASINYWRFRMCEDRTKQRVRIPWLWYWSAPLGLLMHQRDIKLIK